MEPLNAIILILYSSLCFNLKCETPFAPLLPSTSEMSEHQGSSGHIKTRFGQKCPNFWEVEDTTSRHIKMRCGQGE
jgi:hypothetical protein